MKHRNRICIKKYLSLILSAAMLLSVSGCSNQTKTGDSGASEIATEMSASETDVEKQETSDWFSNRDFEIGYDESESVFITLSKNTAACDSDSVQIEDSNVTITDEGTYILSGKLEDGMIIVDAEDTDKLQLVLDGVSIQSSSSAAIYVRQADKVFVTLALDTENVLSNGGEFTAIDENNIDAVIFSKEDITLNGSGALTISSIAGHGIVSKDSLKITSGSYEITCAGHALCGKDEVCIANADFQIDAEKDGIHAENADDETLGSVYIQSGCFDINAGGDGVSASVDVQILDGEFDITAGGEAVALEDMESGMIQPAGNMGMQRPEGMQTPPDDMERPEGMQNPPDDMERPEGMQPPEQPEGMLQDAGNRAADDTDSVSTNGMKAGSTLLIEGGTINITGCYEGLEALCVDISGGEITVIARDDGLNAAGENEFGTSEATITISGGNISVTAGGDGIDANGSFLMTGGYVSVCGPTQGDTATLDYDTEAVISGGTFIGTGSVNMAQTFSDSEQGVLTVYVDNQPAQTTIGILDADGQNILTWEPELSYGIVIYSSPKLVTGDTYTVKIGADTQTMIAD